MALFFLNWSTKGTLPLLLRQCVSLWKGEGELSTGPYYKWSFMYSIESWNQSHFINVITPSAFLSIVYPFIYSWRSKNCIILVDHMTFPHFCKSFSCRTIPMISGKVLPFVSRYRCDVTCEASAQAVQENYSLHSTEEEITIIRAVTRNNRCRYITLVQGSAWKQHQSALSASARRN